MNHIKETTETKGYYKQFKTYKSLKQFENWLGMLEPEFYQKNIRNLSSIKSELKRQLKAFDNPSE